MTSQPLYNVFRTLNQARRQAALANDDFYTSQVRIDLLQN